MVKHLIRHYGKYIYRHEDYQAICQGDDCASQILSLFEFWTVCRLEEIKRVESYNSQVKRGNISLMQIPDLWLYETILDISEGMLNAYGDSSIRKSLKKLIEWGFIDTRKAKHDFDRTKEYKLNTELVQSSLDQWWNSQSIEKSESLKTTQEAVNLTLETVKTTQEAVNLQDDLYSSNSPNKQSILTNSQTPLNAFENLEENLSTNNSNTNNSSLITNKSESLVLADRPIMKTEVSPPPLQNVYVQAKNVWELIDLFLLSPALADERPSDDLLVVYRERNKWDRWVWPWRSPKVSREFKTFNPDVVMKLAKDLAIKNKSIPEQAYSYAMATISSWEKTKGGWENLIGYCDRIMLSESSKEDDLPVQIPEYLNNWYESQHEIQYRKFITSKTLVDWFNASKDNRAWYQFAKEKFPSWDWNKN